VADRGYQLGELVDQLVDYWRSLMLIQVAGPESVDFANLTGDREKMLAHASRVGLDAVLAGLDVLTTTKARMRGSSHPQVLAEVAVIRLSRLGELLSVAELLAGAEAGAPNLPARAAPTSPARPPTRLSAPAESADPLKKNGTLNGRTAPQVPESPTEPAVAPSRPQIMALTPETMPVVWERILQDVGPMRGNQLRHAENAAIIGPNALEIRFSPRYSAAYDACSSEASLGVLRAAVQRTTGTEWQVRVVQDRAEVTAVAAIPQRRRPADLGLLKKAAEVFGLDPANEWRVDDGFNPHTQADTGSAEWSDTDADADDTNPPVSEPD
jgi:DNA polymerase-3 subunit gamma/tau